MNVFSRNSWGTTTELRHYISWIPLTQTVVKPFTAIVRRRSWNTLWICRSPACNLDNKPIHNARPEKKLHVRPPANINKELDRKVNTSFFTADKHGLSNQNRFQVEAWVKAGLGFFFWKPIEVLAQFSLFSKLFSGFERQRICGKRHRANQKNFCNSETDYVHV